MTATVTYVWPIPSCKCGHSALAHAGRTGECDSRLDNGGVCSCNHFVYGGFT